ncbi:hypothetical protein LTR08_008985 [Meristemomyces frigidus]|nr:hypothetical protein LTR08_008985 [Meristemomyces frigidus]
MAPSTTIPLSPAELSYLHTSLSQQPPIRPDGRAPTQFRPLVAETDILPSANGSARICFADGTEAVVGVKAEVEPSPTTTTSHGVAGEEGADRGVRNQSDESGARDAMAAEGTGQGRNAWLDLAIEVPGMRDDDALPVFLAAMLTEALLAERGLKDRLYINARFHWRLYVDILLLSLPLSYPLPLLSLTTHLALLSTRLPALVSEKDEDPLFNDDWEAATHLYPRSTSTSTNNQNKTTKAPQKPPVTLLVMSVGASTILFDPTREELAVADAVLAVSVVAGEAGAMKVVALRTIDPPSRLTSAGVPNALNSTSTATSTSTSAAGSQSLSAADVLALREKDQGQSVWRPPRGGVSRQLVARMIKCVVEKGGVGEEVMEGLGGVEV